jgi:hypothetical protein
VILLLLARFNITSANLGYFVLNNTLNNNTILIKLKKYISFNLVIKRLYYISYIINLIIKAYIFSQDALS